jgi:hypothetical protein
MARGTVPALNLDDNPQVKAAIKDQIKLFNKAMAGDMVIVVSPADATPEPTAAAWSQNFYVELQTAGGEVHTWFNTAVASGHAIATTSVAGVATCLPATTTTYVNGVATIAVSGDTAAWLNAETVTLTVAAQTVLTYTVAQATGVATFTT